MNSTLVDATRRAGRHFELKGFSWSTNQRVFVFVLASALTFVFARDIGLKLVSATALSLGCGLVGVPLIQCVAAIPGMLQERRLLSAAMPAQSPRLLEQYDGLAATMGLPVKRRCPLKIAPGWANAGATIREVVLGETIVEDFGEEARTGVIAHELAHRKGNHVVKFTLAFAFGYLSVACFVSVSHLPSVVGLLGAFSGLALVMSSASWRQEYEADAIAARFVGCQPVIRGLRGFAEFCGADLSHDTWSHPSLERRISRLEKTAG